MYRFMKFSKFQANTKKTILGHKLDKLPKHKTSGKIL